MKASRIAKGDSSHCDDFWRIFRRAELTGLLVSRSCRGAELIT